MSKEEGDEVNSNGRRDNFHCPGPVKNTVTVTGDADPVKVIKKVRKYRRSASVVSIGPPQSKKEDEKKDLVPYPPKTCQRCDVCELDNKSSGI
ncbi:unnamed protein product [Prunus armeniaca]|uniref:HMA domain-containing protein n=1 Tax=Prunus armeniaca TaxID=36596 RepID=A0A6J5TPU7_PRUAR|nr:unnamed protein product [Prunus armeniaca]